jgi:hypothetical protein
LEGQTWHVVVESKIKITIKNKYLEMSATGKVNRVLFCLALFVAFNSFDNTELDVDRSLIRFFICSTG